MIKMAAEQSIYHVNKIFDKVSILPRGLRETQFDECTFKNCDFSETDFYGCDFTKCAFDNCNLSMVKFGAIGFDGVEFIGCKMVGIDFSHAKDFLFGVDFTNCILDYAAFMKKKNKKSKFKNCSLKGADFTEADLTEAKFERCDLNAAVFVSSNLSGANFTSSYNFTIDPEKNQVRKARFSPEGLIGLLANHCIIVEN